MTVARRHWSSAAGVTSMRGDGRYAGVVGAAVSKSLIWVVGRRRQAVEREPASELRALVVRAADKTLHVPCLCEVWPDEGGRGMSTSWSW